MRYYYWQLLLTLKKSNLSLLIFAFKSIHTAGTTPIPLIALRDIPMVTGVEDFRSTTVPDTDMEEDATQATVMGAATTMAPVFTTVEGENAITDVAIIVDDKF